MEVVILPDSAAISGLAADAIGALLHGKPTAVLGLATGSSPLAIYDELAARYQAGLITFAQTRAFTLDEYVDRVSSTSFVAAMSGDERDDFLDEVRDALSPFDGPRELRYLTDVYVWETIGTNPSDEGSSPLA